MSLNRISGFKGIQGPLVTIVLDGVGICKREVGNAVAQARLPNLNKLLQTRPNTILSAHGLAVGMPSDEDMGNSEVGHNAIGAGQVYNQGAALVNEAIASGAIFKSETWMELCGKVREADSTLHLLGLFSDGNVHSHIDHLRALVTHAKKEGLRRVRIHALLDGRDVPATSALEYVEPFEKFLADLRDERFDVRIASGGGRMKITMDRYEADWPMVQAGWKTHVLGEARTFSSAAEAIQAMRADHPGIGDQNLPPFVITDNKGPVGKIMDHDAVILFNFRGDRAIQISKAFEKESFSQFDRVRHPKVFYAGMLQYDGDEHIPQKYLVSPPAIRNTLGQHLAESGISQLAISETQKYGHVTYFWNGNRSGKFDDKSETYIEIPSDVVPFDQRPWMKSAEITDELIRQLQSGRHKALRVNYANGDMVGHTGDMMATIVALESVDLCLGRILPVIDRLKGAAIITADHGNADEMYELDKKSNAPVALPDGSFKPKTSHTLNPVPCIIYDNFCQSAYELKPGHFGLGNIAATMANLLGYQAQDSWNESLISIK